MKPYYEHSGITIYHGDCRDVLPPMRAVSAVVCDPPYGLSFMGKGWDYAVPGIKFWTAVNNSLLPGSYMLTCGGTRTYHRLTCAIEDAGFEIRDCLQWLYGSGFPKSHKLGDGKGTALKPAYEPIVLARKSFAGTATACHTAHGTAALNVDACRVETDGRPLRVAEDHGLSRGTYEGGAASSGGSRALGLTELGRWPSNVLLDEEAAAMLDEQTGELRPGHNARLNSVGTGSRGIYGRFTPVTTYGPSDTGGASRFFYVAKASRRERGDFNTHPTVKPVALMRYLVRLITPPNGTVLDPFMGSGTTLLAALRENRSGIGIEIEERYCEIAAKRLQQEVLPLERLA